MSNNTELLKRMTRLTKQVKELRDGNESFLVRELREQVKELKASIIRTAKLESERGSFHP